MQTKTKPRSRFIPPIKPAPAPEPVSREDLIAEVGKVLDSVDEQLKLRKDTGVGRSINWFYPNYGEPFYTISRRIQDLSSKLEEVLDPKREAAEMLAPDLLAETYRTPLGERVMLSRGGEFLLWVGDIPMRVVWGGFLQRDKCGLEPLDGRKLWPVAADGWLRVNEVTCGVVTADAAVRAWLIREMQPRRAIRGKLEGPMQMRELTQAEREKAATFLQQPGNGWWREHLRRGPVDPVPLPAGIPAVQALMF